MTELTAVPQSRPQRTLERLIGMVWIFASASMTVGILLLLISGNNPPGRDDISFWAAAHQLTTHADPYDAASTLNFERAAGFPPAAQALIMRNPPYALPLVLPLAPFQLKGASLMWSLLLLCSLMLSVHILWGLFGRPANWIHLLGYTFGPALICVLGGQSAIFALLGLVLFLRLHRDHAFAAGASLWLCALKPHLFLPFGVVLLLWIIMTRRFRILAGAALALAATSALATWIDPTAWSQYARMMHTPNIQAEFIPTFGYLLRDAVPHHPAWLQYLPTAFACAWAVYYFSSRRQTWDWLRDSALLMLISLIASPYAWVSDQSILIPALLAGAYRADSRLKLGLLALSSALIDIAQLAGKSMHSVIYTFGPPIWLAWYLYSTRNDLWGQRRDSSQDIAIGVPEAAVPSL